MLFHFLFTSNSSKFLIIFYTSELFFWDVLIFMFLIRLFTIFRVG